MIPFRTLRLKPIQFNKSRLYSKKQRTQVLESTDYEKMDEELKSGAKVKDLMIKEAEEKAKKLKHTKYQGLFPGEEDIPTEANIVRGEIDREYEELRKIAGYGMHDPDYIIYDSIMKYRIKMVELEWMFNGESMSGHGVNKLSKKISQIISDTDQEFENHLALFEYGSAKDIELSRQKFIDEMGGEILFFEDDSWKKDLLRPEFDPRQNPTLEKEVKQLLGSAPTMMRLDSSQDSKNLYQHYDKLIQFLSDDKKGIDGSVDRIFAHLSQREDAKGVLERRTENLEQAKKLMEEQKHIMDQIVDPNISYEDFDFKDEDEYQ